MVRHKKTKQGRTNNLQDKPIEVTTMENRTAQFVIEQPLHWRFIMLSHIKLITNHSVGNSPCDVCLSIKK